jgi:PASTA domain
VPTVKNNAVPYLVLLDGYSILPLPNPPNFIDLQHQMDVLAQCATWRNMDLQTLNDIAFIKSNPAQFTDVNMGQLSQSENNISADLNTIAAAASNAVNNPSTAALPQLKVPPPLALPSRVMALFVTIPVYWTGMRDPSYDSLDGSRKSAATLGLVAKYVTVPNNNPNVEGDIASMSPPAGTQVEVGTTVTISVYGRAPND